MKTTFRQRHSLLFALFLILLLLPHIASAVPYVEGDIFVSVCSRDYQGVIDHFSADGTYLETLNTNTPCFTTGMEFDMNGNLYVAMKSTSANSKVFVFDNSGVLQGTFGSGHLYPEDIVFDRNGNAYVTNVSSRGIRMYDLAGNFIKSMDTKITRADFLDLTADNKTLYFTQEGMDIKTVDIATGKLGPNFTTSTARQAFALRILPDGGVLLADLVNIKRYNSQGQVIQTYSVPGLGHWFGLNLDIDGTSFWSADYITGNIYKFDIDTGIVLQKFKSHSGPSTWGLIVYGEPTAALRAATDVRVIETIPNAGIELDGDSFSNPPVSVSAGIDTTTIEWHFDAFQIGQSEDLSFDVILKNPRPGEDRLVNQKLELSYVDINGVPMYAELGPYSVHVQDSAFDTSLTTDKASYQVFEDVNIGMAITNLSGYPRMVDATLVAEDSQGTFVKEVAAFAGISFLSGETRNLSNLIFNTGSYFSGSYRVRLILMENQIQVGESAANFTIEPTITVIANIVTNKIAYQPNEQATITSSITSQSQNYIFENLTTMIKITSPFSPPCQGGDWGGCQPLHTETQIIPILTPGQLTEIKTFWNTSTYPAGTYPVTLEVKDASGTMLSTNTTNITISSDIKPSKLLKGQISVDKQTILQGEPVNITYSITNIGNMNLADIALSIPVVHVVQLTPYDTLTDQTALAMGSAYTNTKPLITQNYSAKDYLVVLKANISGVEETLAGSYFRVEGAPSAPSLNSPKHGTDIETPTPTLTVNNASDPNDDRLTYQFEVYGDSSLSTMVTSSGNIEEGLNITSWWIPLSLNENAWYFWRARSYDGRLYGEWMPYAGFRVNVTNEPPTAPTLSSPAESSSVDTLTPILTVNNSSDPDSVNLTYNFMLSSDTDFANIIASQTGIFAGTGTTSWQVPLNLTENTYYYWSAQADDWLITGPWMTPARFFVNTANDAPAAPTVIYPSNGSEITTLSTDITTLNSTDPDSSSLTYIFETDTAMTFDSPNLARSGNIPEGQGTTSSGIANLSDNTYYYTRVKASDGLAESPWSDVISFFVNTQNDAPSIPALSNPSDGSGVNTFNPVLSIHNSSDIDHDILTYDFEIYDDAAMTNLVSSLAGITETPQMTSWTVPVALTENKTYYWRARTYDGELYSGWMPQASFMINTANDAPTAPTLHSPAEGSSLDTLNPALSIYNASDPDSDSLTYDFEIYSGGILIKTITGIPQNISGITSVTMNTPLTDNTTYNWRARAYDGDRYGAWMDMASFSIHLPQTNITATIDFDPNTLNKKSKGTWVVVYIELPSGYNVSDINISSVRFEGIIPAESWPYAVGDYDKDGIPDLMVKFNRNDVINILPNGDNIPVHVTGTVGSTTFEGVDRIRVIP